MIDGDNHYVAKFGELRAVVTRAVAGAGGETAAVEGDHDRALRAVVDTGGPDVEREAVLAHAADVEIPLDHHAVIAVQVGEGLRADLAVAEAFADAGPGRGFLGRQVAILSSRRRAIGDAFEFLNSGVGDALDFAGG